MWQSRLETYSQCRKAKNSFSLHKWNQSTMQWDITEISRKFMVRHVKFIILSCGMYGILLPRFCRKNSVEITFWWRTNRIFKKIDFMKKMCVALKFVRFTHFWQIAPLHLFFSRLANQIFGLRIWKKTLAARKLRQSMTYIDRFRKDGFLTQWYNNFPKSSNFHWKSLFSNLWF